MKYVLCALLMVFFSKAALAVDSVCGVATIGGKQTVHHTVSWTTYDAAFGGWIRIVSEVTFPSWLGVWDDYAAGSPWSHMDYVPNPINATYVWYGDSYAGHPDAEGTGFWYIPWDTCSNSANIYNQYCSDSLTNYFAIQQSHNWPSSEPYERGVSITCASSTGTYSYANYRDSFGIHYSGYTPTMDPCVLSLLPGANNVGGLHSHPYFNAPSEYMAGIGCHNFDGPTPTTPSQFELNQLNNDNNDFGPGDSGWVTGTSTPFFLKTPTGAQVKRMNLNQTTTVIY